MGEDEGATIRESFEHKRQWENECYTAAQGSQANSANDCVGENGSIVQGATDGHKAVKGHRQQHRGLQKGQTVNEKELSKTSILTDISCPNQKDAKHCRECAKRQTQVSQSQHGQEEVHWLME